METFGWSTQPSAAPSDDADLLAAFLGTSFDDQLHSGGGGGGDGNVSSDAYGGLDLPSSRHDVGLLRCHDGVTVPSGASSTGFHHLNPVGFLPVPAIAGTHDGRLGLDRFGFPADVPEEHAQAAGSNTVFSGYSTTTGGGNISSGESNTYGGGHDTEVASSSSRPVVVMPPSKRKLVLGKYPAATTTDQEAEERWGTKRAAATTTSITFGQSGGGGGGGRGYELDTEAIAQVKEMIYRAAAMRPMNLGGPSPGSGPSSAAPDQKPRRRKNVRISSDPQTVAARLRREKVSERLRALQRLVPGGSKMDTASMLDEAASYLRFLKSQLAALETLDAGSGGGRSVQLPQRFVDMGGRLNHSQLSFGRDGITGYVRSSRNMQL